MASSNTRILIIGGGLAGLSLGQGLKQAGIPFHIFERDTSASFRAQGYRIRISPDGAHALQRLLPENLWRAFEATCATVIHGGHQIDASTGLATEWAKRPPPPAGGLDGKSYNTDRAVLRNLLLSGLEYDVSFGKHLDRYDVDSNEVLAHFADGTSERGSFLVGADGIRSVVRRQLIRAMVLLDTEGRAVFGKTPISKIRSQSVPDEIYHGICLAGKSSDRHMKLFCDTMSFDRDTIADSGRTLGLDIPEDYIYWVLLFRKDVVTPEQESKLLSLSNQESIQLSLDLTASWHESLRTIIQHQLPDAASTLAFLTASPDFVCQWSSKASQLKGFVTLMGDSAHAMPPVGGLGANAGFQDSADLLDAFLEIANSNSGMNEQLVDSFEDKMLARAKIAVDKSSGGAGHFFGMKSIDELKPAVYRN